MTVLNMNRRPEGRKKRKCIFCRSAFSENFVFCPNCRRFNYLRFPFVWWGVMIVCAPVVLYFAYDAWGLWIVGILFFAFVIPLVHHILVMRSFRKVDKAVAEAMQYFRDEAPGEPSDIDSGGETSECLTKGADSLENGVAAEEELAETLMRLAEEMDTRARRVDDANHAAPEDSHGTAC